MYNLQSVLKILYNFIRSVRILSVCAKFREPFVHCSLLIVNYSSLLSYYVQLDLCFYLTVEASYSGVLTKFLDRLSDSDHFLVD